MNARAVPLTAFTTTQKLLTHYNPIVIRVEVEKKQANIHYRIKPFDSTKKSNGKNDAYVA